MFGFLCLLDRFDQTQFIAYNEGVFDVPGFVAHRTPLVVMVNFHSSCAIFFGKVIGKV